MHGVIPRHANSISKAEVISTSIDGLFCVVRPLNGVDLGYCRKVAACLISQTSKCGVDDCFKSPSVSRIREASSKVISVNIANKKLKGDASRVASETKRLKKSLDSSEKSLVITSLGKDAQIETLEKQLSDTKDQHKLNLAKHLLEIDKWKLKRQFDIGSVKSDLINGLELRAERRSLIIDRTCT
jgi:hypothetical protein